MSRWQSGLCGGLQPRLREFDSPSALAGANTSGTW